MFEGAVGRFPGFSDSTNGITRPNIHGATHRKAGPANVKERRRCETPFDLLTVYWHVLFHDAAWANLSRINIMS